MPSTVPAVLNQVAPNIWFADGEQIRFYGMPFPTRMVICKLSDGTLWVHSPTKLTEQIRYTITSLGSVNHLIAPNVIHYWYMSDWQRAFPDAITYAEPTTVKRAEKYERAFIADHSLIDTAPTAWQPDITGASLSGEQFLNEVIFFHHPSRTLVVTDFFENFDVATVPWYFRPLVRLAGAAAPYGATTIDQRWFYRKHRKQLLHIFDQVKMWEPERIIMAHGEVVNEPKKYLERALHWL